MNLNMKQTQPFVFCNILTYMDNYIWQFRIFMGEGFTA